MRRRIKFVLYTGLIFAILVAGIFLYGRENTWELAGPADQGDVNFATLERGPKPNQYIICPADLCQAGLADAAGPVYVALAADLRAALREIALAEPMTELVGSAADMARDRFVQRTPLMRYPDTVVVEFLPAGEATTTMAAYSRSLIGYSDRDENGKRLNRWIAALDEKFPRADQ